MSVVKESLALIENGETESNAVDLGELAVVGLQNGTLTSTAFTFLASYDGITYVAVKRVDGTAYSITVASDTYTVIPPIDLAGVRFLKIVAGSTELADRNIRVMVRAV